MRNVAEKCSSAKVAESAYFRSASSDRDNKWFFRIRSGYYNAGQKLSRQTRKNGVVPDATSNEQPI